MTDAEYTHWARPCVEFEVCEPLKPYRSKRLPKKVKTVTVHKQYYFYASKNNPNQNSRPVPWLNLRGDWLAQAGFEIGSRYSVEVFDNQLVLTVVE